MPNNIQTTLLANIQIKQIPQTTLKENKSKETPQPTSQQALNKNNTYKHNTKQPK